MNKFFAAAFILAMAPMAAHATHIPLPAAQAALNRAEALVKEKKPDQALNAFVQAVEADPEWIAPHDALQKFDDKWSMAPNQDPKSKAEADAIAKTIGEKYKEWERRFPDALGILYGAGKWLDGKEDPQAQSYLLKVVARDPNNASVYELLATTLPVMLGDGKAALGYLRHATELEPNNASYALNYAETLDGYDRAEGRAALLDVAKRFPTSDAGAQAFSDVAFDEADDAKRVALLEQLRTKFPAGKFPTSHQSMGQLFDTYLRVDPPKAVALARQMEHGEDAGKWAKRVRFAEAYIKINQMVDAGNAKAAAKLLGQLKQDGWSSNEAMLVRLRAQVLAGCGRTAQGYQLLLKQQVEAPDVNTRSALVKIGGQLHKTPDQVDADIEAKLHAGSKVAPPINLAEYGSDRTVSLADLRGKVVLVTFWFPACGPCRDEMPRLDAVMRKFRGKDVVFLGVNGNRDQDAFVLPLVKVAKYSFVPLKSTKAVLDSYGVEGFPSNFLIDRQGRIVYQGFTANDQKEEEVLQQMIESLL